MAPALTIRDAVPEECDIHTAESFARPRATEGTQNGRSCLYCHARRWWHDPGVGRSGHRCNEEDRRCNVSWCSSSSGRWPMV